jgi:hypothetical protein
MTTSASRGAVRDLRGLRRVAEPEVESTLG